MTVIGTVNEINAALQWIHPGFPRQNLESIRTNECCYFVNGAKIEVVLIPEAEDGETVRQH